MPSFDVVSEVEMAEVHNAVDQANREIGTRFDFKGADAKFTREGSEITMAPGSSSAVSMFGRWKWATSNPAANKCTRP